MLIHMDLLHLKIWHVHMGVSKNRGTPKSSILIGVFHYKPSILGYPYFWKHPYFRVCLSTISDLMTRWTNSIFGVLLGLKVSMVFCATCRWKIALKIGYHGCRLRQCVVDSQGPKGIFWVLFLHPKVLLASRKDFSALILVEDLDSPTSLSLPCYHSID